VLHSLWRRWRERRELRQRIVEELRFHLREAAEDNMAAGLSPQAARDEATFRLGDQKAIAHQCYQLMCDAPTDAAGSWSRVPVIAYALAALIVPPILVMLLIPHYVRELPQTRPDQLNISNRRVARGFDVARAAPDEAAAFRRFVARLGWPGEAGEAFAGQTVSANFFELQGVRPLLGPGFTEAPLREIAISYRLWRENLGADPAIVGRLVEVNGTPYRVVAVMPEEYWFLSDADRFWTRALGFAGREIHASLLVRPGGGEAIEYLNTLDEPVRWDPLRAASHVQVRAAAGIVQAALILLALLGLVQMWSLRRTLEKHRTARWTLLRNYFFLFAKAVPPLVLLAILWLALRLSPASYFAGVWALISTFVFAMLCVAVVWQSLVDQRLRCIICLRQLSMPLPLGVIGSILFQLPGTEYICAYGHGTLFVPAPTSEGLRELDWNPPAGLWAELLQPSTASRS
jgi:hypothetical protein